MDIFYDFMGFSFMKNEDIVKVIELFKKWI